MPVTVERKVSPALKQSKTGWTYDPEFIVRGVDTEAHAMRAVDATTGLAVPRIGDSEGGLICSGREVSEHPAPSVFFIKASFAGSEYDDGDGTEPPEEPIVRWRWKQGERSRDVECDVDGNPIVNSAGIPFSDSFSDEDSILILTAWRKQPLYDPVSAHALRNRVNSQAMNVLGIQLDGEQLWCKRIEPTNDQTPDTTVVEVEHEFWMTSGYRPWQLRVPDKSHMGLYLSDGEYKAGLLYPLDHRDPVDEAVLLNGEGLPINASHYAIKLDPDSTGVIPETNPNVPDWFEIAPESNDNGTILIFTRKHKANFRGLIPGVM